MHCKVLVCIFNLNLEVKSPKSFLSPYYDKSILNNFRESELFESGLSLGQKHFQIRVSMCTAKHKLATFGTTCVFKSVKRLRLSSVTGRNGNRNAPTLLTEWVPEGQIITLLAICKSWQHYESEFVRIGQSSSSRARVLLT